MKYLSLFTGIGGFELGITQAYEANISRLSGESTEGNGETESSKPSSQTTPKSIQRRGDKSDTFVGRDAGSLQCIGYSEIDKYATQVYQSHFNHTNYGDITKIQAEDLPNFDFLCGGFPDTRGTLFFDIVRILKAKRPRLFLLENVKGLLSHDEGRTFGTIISTLDELGYDLQWQVLNSKNFGVPQNRERVFIVGNLRGTSRPKVFPFTGESQNDTRITGTQVARSLDANYFKGVSPNGHQGSTWQLVQLNQPTHSNDRVYSPEGLSPTLNTMQGGLRQPKIVASRGRAILSSKRTEYGKEIRKEYEAGEIKEQRKNIQKLEPRKDEITNTLTGVQKDNMLLEGLKIRRLTPKECERLQGFPDDWTACVSDSQRYKCCGNAVTVNVIQAIMEKLL